MSTPILSEEEVFRHYKANSPFAGEICFADYLNQSLRDGNELKMPWAKAASVLDALIAKNSLHDPTTLYRATVDVRRTLTKLGFASAGTAYLSQHGGHHLRLFTRVPPNNSFKPTPLRGAA